MSLEDVEALLIKKALARFNGNVSHAANALGLSRSALYRRLQRYGLVIGNVEASSRESPGMTHDDSARSLMACRSPGRTARLRRSRSGCSGSGDFSRAVAVDPHRHHRRPVVGFAFAVRERVVFPLQTLSNLLGALREGDFSVRGRSAAARRRAGRSHARSQHARQHAARAAPRRAWKPPRCCAPSCARSTSPSSPSTSISAPPGESRRRALCWPARRAPARAARRRRSSWTVCLDGAAADTCRRLFPAAPAAGACAARAVRERGLPLELVVISDFTQALSEQELQAWQRLVRVLGHELNNSLTPIKSIAGSLASLLARRPLPDDWRDDMQPRPRRHHLPLRSPQPLHRRLRAAGKLPRPQLQPLDVATASAAP